MSRSQRKRRERTRKWIMRVLLLAVLAVAVYVTVKALPKLKTDAPEPSGTSASANNSGGSTAGNSGSKTQTGNGGTASQTGNQTGTGGNTGSGGSGSSQSGAGGSAQSGGSGASAGTEEPNTGTVTTPADPRATFIICIDPGHGYADPGCLCELEEWKDVPEKDITLPISLKLRDKLEAMGYAVVMTREDDVYPDWLREQREAEGHPIEKMDGYTRCNIANDAEAFLFVSIHVDKAQNSKAHGVRMYYYTGNTTTTADYAKMLAAGVNDALMEQVQTVGLNYDDAYIMNKYVNMPSVLIEVGFFSNADDAQRMQDEVWQSTLAQGIADGIEKYWQKYGAS